MRWQLVLCAGLMGCSALQKTASKDKATTPAPASAATLDGPADPQFGALGGSWQVASGCSIATASGGGSATGSFNTGLTFTSAHFITALSVYSDSACATLTTQAFQVYQYATGTIVAGSQLRAIEFTTQAIGLSYAAADTVSALNSSQFCGYSDWQAGVPKLTPLAGNCAGSGSPSVSGQQVWNSYEVSGSTLTFGLLPAGTTLGVPTEAAAPAMPGTPVATKLSEEDATIAKNLDILLGAVAAPTGNSGGTATGGTGIGSGTGAGGTSSGKASITFFVPEMPAQSDQLEPFLEFTITPSAAGAQILVLDVNAQQNTPTSLAAGTYTVKVAEVTDQNKSTPMASGTGSVTVVEGVSQTVTIHVK